ncbi:MAG: lipoyl(octanoyl) transferase LipB [Flavobacteriaceae bacterium]
MNKKVLIEDLGRRDYKDTWDFQELLFKETVDQKIANRRQNAQHLTSNHLLIVEHDHVFTLGKSGDFSNLLVSNAELSERKAAFYKINRGGDITYHGPGQIVGYPILDLDHFFSDIHKYLRFLEEIIILTLKDFSIRAERSSGETGVWLDVDTPKARKICAMGIRASRWVTMHGFALNVEPDMRYFDMMVPCGIQGKAVTSMKQELKDDCPTVEEVKEVILKYFAQLFEVEFIPSDRSKGFFDRLG